MLVVAIVVDAWRWWALKKVARETGSEALEADALHFSSDLVNSVLVLAAFGAAALGYPQADSLVAVGVSLFIAFAGFRLAQRTINTLLDAAPKGLAEQIRAKVAEAVPGVVSVERVRVRPAGGEVFGEILVKVPRTLPLEKVAEIKRRDRRRDRRGGAAFRDHHHGRTDAARRRDHYWSASCSSPRSGGCPSTTSSSRMSRAGSA